MIESLKSTEAIEAGRALSEFLRAAREMNSAHHWRIECARLGDPRAESEASAGIARTIHAFHAQHAALRRALDAVDAETCAGLPEAPIRWLSELRRRVNLFRSLVEVAGDVFPASEEFRSLQFDLVECAAVLKNLHPQCHVRGDIAEDVFICAEESKVAGTPGEEAPKLPDDLIGVSKAAEIVERLTNVECSDDTVRRRTQGNDPLLQPFEVQGVLMVSAAEVEAKAFRVKKKRASRQNRGCKPAAK